MREYKMPVAEFYRRFRVKYGRWLLQNSELSNAQIAIDCGFSDYSHFHRVYRAIYGEQPTRQR
jgi:transcriptional regulator GlxA family with amidase domain